MSKAMKKNIVLLGTDSRDSSSKSSNYAKAAAELGLELKAYPDSETIGVLPCSDFKAVDAAWLAKIHGIPGADSIMATVATNKALAYHFLQQQGFEMLFWHVPLRDEDFSLPFKGPIILKPEKGSGSFAHHPWGYQVFESLADFRRYLVRNKLKDLFFAYQADPSWWYGRYIAMEYVDAKELYSVAAAVGDKGLSVYDFSTMSVMDDCMQVEWMLVGEKHPDADSVVRMIEALAARNLRRTIIYIQCVAKNGRLFPIDLNLRPGTMGDCAIRALDLPFYPASLAFMLGLADEMQFAWPAPRVGIKRINVPIIRQRRQVAFGTGAVPLISELSFNPKKPYDLGHAYPMFAVLCDSRSEFEQRISEIEAATSITKIAGNSNRRGRPAQTAVASAL